MRHDDDDCIVAAQDMNGTCQCILAVSIQIGIRLIEHHQKRVPKHRTRQPDSLPLAR